MQAAHPSALGGSGSSFLFAALTRPALRFGRATQTRGCHTLEDEVEKGSGGDWLAVVLCFVIPCFSPLPTVY
jgi:hypothetical protein